MAINGLTALRNAERSGDSTSADVRQALAQASRPTGVDFAYLVAEASVESSLNPNAKAKTSSAAGLFQLIESTWEFAMVPRLGLARKRLRLPKAIYLQATAARSWVFASTQRSRPI
jgi:soluble lytic murein transglycosylase-like protein